MPTPEKPGAPRKPRVRRRKSSTGDMPLDYMLKVMRDDEADAKRRDDMAKIAARYIHHKPERTKDELHPTIDLTSISDEQLSALESLFGPMVEPEGDDRRGSGGEEPPSGGRNS